MRVAGIRGWGDGFRHWCQLLAEWGTDDDAGRLIFLGLCKMYNSPGRVYHTLDHVRHVLDTAASLREYTQDYPAVQLAAWFHDVVYDTRASDNEERSAAYAAAALQHLSVPAATIGKVQTLILATKSHQPSPDPDGRVLLDADLAILGADEATYGRYAQAIRAEYAWVSDDLYRSGRRRVLTAFLQRDRLFQTEPLYRVLERPARQNIRRELEQLSHAG